MEKRLFFFVAADDELSRRSSRGQTGNIYLGLKRDRTQTSSVILTSRKSTKEGHDDCVNIKVKQGVFFSLQFFQVMIKMCWMKRRKDEGNLSNFLVVQQGLVTLWPSSNGLNTFKIALAIFFSLSFFSTVKWKTLLLWKAQLLKGKPVGKCFVHQSHQNCNQWKTQCLLALVNYLALAGPHY